MLKRNPIIITLLLVIIVAVTTVIVFKPDAPAQTEAYPRDNELLNGTDFVPNPNPPGINPELARPK